MGKGAKAPQPYMPTYSAQADQAYQDAVGKITPYAQDLPGQVIPGLQQVVTSTVNNPYYADAQVGANTVNSTAQGQVAPNMLQASNDLYGTGMSALDAAPQVTAGAGYAQPLLESAISAGGEAKDAGHSAYDRGRMLSDTAYGAIPYLTGGMPEAQTVLNTGFDPQQLLYNRDYQQQQDQTNAINAMYGLSSSPYGAGVAGDASRNFNLDWGDRQLGRQISALGAYGQEQGNVANILNNLINTSSGTFNQGVDNYRQGIGTYLQGITTGTNAYNGMMGGAVDRFGNLVNTANSAFGQGGAQGIDALNTLTTASQLPSQTYLQQQQANLGALQGLINGTTGALQPMQDVANLNNQYLKTGQTATQLAQNATQINNARSAATLGAITSTLGTIAGIALAPVTGGASLFASVGANMSHGINLNKQG